MSLPDWKWGKMLTALSIEFALIVLSVLAYSRGYVWAENIVAFYVTGLFLLSLVMLFSPNEELDEDNRRRVPRQFIYLLRGVGIFTVLLFVAFGWFWLAIAKMLGMLIVYARKQSTQAQRIERPSDVDYSDPSRYTPEILRYQGFQDMDNEIAREHRRQEAMRKAWKPQPKQKEEKEPTIVRFEDKRRMRLRSNQEEK